MKFDPELVSGSVFRSVLKFSWPVILLQLVSGVHGFVDQMIVGRYVGYEAIAGVGVSWQIFLVILVSLSSLFHGMGIMIARYSGRRDQDAVNRIAFEVLLAAVYLLLLVVAPVGYLLSPSLLELANASPEVTAHGLPYLRIVFTSSIGLFALFLLNGAFMSAGDPRTPLALGVLSTVVNIGTTYLLVAGVGPIEPMGTRGAAVGTCFGPVPSVLIAIYLVMKHRAIIGPPKRFALFPDLSVIDSVARIGIPSGIQAVLLNVGGLLLFGFIGSLPLSAESQAAYTICYGQLFSLITWTGFGLRAAAATVMGQNLGAGHIDRGKRSVYVSAAIGFLWAAFFGFLYYAYPIQLLNLFDVDDAQVQRIGTELLQYLSVSGLFVLVALAFTGGLQGAGDTKRPMYIAFITQIVVLLGICFVFQQMGRLTTTVIWSAILTSHATRLVLSYAVFKRGKWIDIKVELKDKPAT